MLLVLGDVLVEEQLVRISILPTTALSPALVSVRTSDDKVFTLVIAKTDTCATPGMEDSGRHTPVVYGFTPPLAPIMRIFCQSILLIFMSIYLLHTMIGQCRILLNQVEYSRKFKPDPIIAEHVRDNNRGILVYAGGAATGAATGYWYRRYNALPTVRYFYRPPVNFKRARKREFLSCFTPKKSPLILVIRNTRVQAEVRSLLNTHYSPIKTRDGTLYVPKTANTESKLR